jgi:hypothetical protein
MTLVASLEGSGVNSVSMAAYMSDGRERYTDVDVQVEFGERKAGVRRD